jgi:hypothetical protein
MTTEGTPPAGEGSSTPEPQKINVAVYYGPGVTPPEGATALPDRALEMRVNTFRSYGVPEVVLEQVRAGKPVTEQEYTLAQAKKSSLMQDKGWVQKYLDGDQDARRTMAMISIILGSKIKEENNG